MERILVSACLLGERVRYDGQAALWAAPDFWWEWREEGRLLPFCAECAAGFSVPRPSAELQWSGGHGRVFEQTGAEVTAQFLRGAQLTLECIRRNNIRIAVLKEHSPSCGVSTIYDGSFAGQKVAGQGVVTALLRQHGIRVFSEHQLAQVRAFLLSLP